MKYSRVKTLLTLLKPIMQEMWLVGGQTFIREDNVIWVTFTLETVDLHKRESYHKQSRNFQIHQLFGFKSRQA